MSSTVAENTITPGKVSTDLGVATSARKLETARKISGVSFDGTADITIPRSSKRIAMMIGTQGAAGYIKMCTIKVTETYADHPLKFTVSQHHVPHYDVVFMFGSTNNTDPPIATAYYASDRKGETPSAYYVKSATSTWDIYIKKIEGYDHIFVSDYQKADAHEGTCYTVTWKDEQVSALPTGYVQLSNVISVATASANGLMSAADKTKLDKISDTAVEQTRLYEETGLNAAGVTVEIEGLFTKYNAVICNIHGESDSTCVLPLKYVKPLTSKPYYYNGCGHYFQYVNNNTMIISTGFAQVNPKIYSVEIISLY